MENKCERSIADRDMIPRNYIEAWRNEAPWISTDMVEQDLILSKAITDIYNNTFLRERLAFRGGTAIYKLFVRPPARYSEDLDFIQIAPEELKRTCDEIRGALSWIDKQPAFKQKGDNFTFHFKYQSEEGTKKKVKIEINCREHIAVYGPVVKEFKFENPFHSASASVVTFELEELLASKLRALYQRRKGRDLFDLWYVNSKMKIEVTKLLEAFPVYVENTKKQITSKGFLRNLRKKRTNKLFLEDIRPLINPAIQYDQEVAFDWVESELIEKI